MRNREVKKALRAPLADTKAELIPALFVGAAAGLGRPVVRAPADNLRQMRRAPGA
jgi:hypothetical protein